MTFTAAPIVTTDLPCHGCGYNLRGLPLDGRCPECGASVAATVATAEVAARRFRPDVAAASPASRRRWAGGLACVLASAAVMAGVSLLPEGWQRPHGPAWGAVLSVAVVGWVLAFVGVWQVVWADPAVDAEPRTANAVGLRAAVLVASLLPGAAGLSRSTVAFGYGWAVIPCWLLVPVVTVAFHLRLRGLAMAAGARMVAGQCVALAVALPLWSCGTMGLSDYKRGSSLQMLFESPTPAYGSSAVAAWAAVALAHGDEPATMAVGLAVPVWGLTVTALTLWRVIRPAGGRGRTVPSSRP